jgi:predicted deacylase
MVRGASDGPVLLVQAGLTGHELEPALVLPKLVEELDASDIRGTLLVVPLLNGSGFEFAQKNAVWDNKDLNGLGRGKAGGSVSEELVHFYFQNVVGPADALLDIRTGGLAEYHRYAGIYQAGAVEKSLALAVALGLPQVLVNQPEAPTIAREAAVDGKSVASAWIGGAPGFRDYLEEDQARIRRAVLNAMRHLGMMDGPVDHEADSVTTIRGHTFFGVSGERGPTFIFKEKRGQLVEAGEPVGLVKHPFTGDVVRELVAPRDGVMLHAGAAWPMVPEDATLAILGDVVDRVKVGG